MFAGIVTAKGRLEEVPASGRNRFQIAHPLGWGGLSVGDSVAVNGCCLTAVEVAAAGVGVEVMPETLRRTTLAGLAIGDWVNLEQALQLQGVVGGHLVTGHVDAVGEVLSVRDEGNAVWLAVRAPRPVARHCVPQGSITVDGCSLTLVSVEDHEDRAATLEVSLIPHTVAATVAGGYRSGALVNLESDVIAKLIERLVGPYGIGRERPRSDGNGR
ncbi:MAG: riboflavin synthase [Candidatus Dormibacteria bacterium]